MCVHNPPVKIPTVSLVAAVSLMATVSLVAPVSLVTPVRLGLEGILTAGFQYAIRDELIKILCPAERFA